MLEGNGTPIQNILPKNEFTNDTHQNNNNVDWKSLLVIFLLFIITGNPLTYNLELQFLPVSLRRGNPPYALVILNSIIATLIFFIYVKYLRKYVSKY